MLVVTFPEVEGFDEKTNEFYTLSKKTTIQLEHSLVSLAKWESRWHKPFLDSLDKLTQEETIDYIRCMTITQNVDPNVYLALTPAIMKSISAYIEDPMTATWFAEDRDKTKKPGIKHRGNGEKLTAELIYYYMVALNIPFECQKWHLNRLFTLIKVCSIKNEPPKKMSKRDLASRNTALNAARRKALHTTG